MRLAAIRSVRAPRLPPVPTRRRPRPVARASLPHRARRRTWILRLLPRDLPTTRPGTHRPLGRRATHPGSSRRRHRTSPPHHAYAGQGQRGQPRQHGAPRARPRRRALLRRPALPRPTLRGAEPNGAAKVLRPGRDRPGAPIPSRRLSLVSRQATGCTGSVDCSCAAASELLQLDSAASRLVAKRSRVSARTPAWASATIAPRSLARRARRSSGRSDTRAARTASVARHA